jgi:drug/metabolite transporter (DMT)-like permease
VTILLALASACTYGAADFLGGLAARRATALAVVAVSQLAGLGLLLLLLPLLPDGDAAPADFLWAGASGIAGGIGVVLLYRGLAIGPMSLVAPVTAVCAAVLPVVVGLAFGEDLPPAALAGIAFAFPAIALVSRATAPPGAPAGARANSLLIALGAGVSFSAFFVLLDHTSSAAGLWPLLGTRAGSLLLVVGVASVGRRSLMITRSALPTTFAAGALDMAANVFFLLAVNRGFLSIVAVLTSLYPAATVLLARTLLKERMNRFQMTGIACAGVAVALIAGS